MAVYSFSTKSESDTLLILAIKKECADKGLNFSKVIIKALKDRENSKEKPNG